MSSTHQVIDVYKDACEEAVHDHSCTEPVETCANTGAGVFVEGRASAENKGLFQDAY